MRWSWWVCAWCLGCFVWGGCQDAVVARVNGVPIHRRAFLRRVAMESNHHVVRTADHVGRQQRIERMVLRRMVDFEKLRQRAEQLGIDAGDDVLAKQLALRRARLGGDNAYRQWLAATRTTPEELTLQETETYLEEQVVERLVGPVVVPQEDLERYAQHEREEEREHHGDGDGDDDDDEDEDEDEDKDEGPEHLRAEMLHGGVEGARAILTSRYCANNRRAMAQKIRAGGTVQVYAPYVLE